MRSRWKRRAPADAVRETPRAVRARAEPDDVVDDFGATALGRDSLLNEQEVLGEVHRRLSDVCHEVCGSSYELVFVNDGSRDRTWELMREAALEDPHIVAVNLSRNHG